MKIAIPKERRAGEARVAATPETVKKLIALGAEVAVEAGAGMGAAITDAAFAAAGAAIVADPGALLSSADVILKVQRPMSAAEGADELAQAKPGALLIGVLAAFSNKDQVADYARRKLTAFSMELMPRITRAQAMDVLSSQSNLAGYKAVVDAASEFGRVFPMMMTAAGTVPPARVLVLGAGVAGLQAIATARRLGAIVSAFDVRPVAKEQVESLGATFVMVESAEVASAETKGGYAKEMSEDYKRKQADKIHETLKKQDIAICTALIPGKRAPILITDAMVRDMKPGSVIVDLAVEAGGNCEGAEYGKIVVKHGVKIMGYANVPARVAVDASALYARNLLQLVTLLIDKDTKQLKINWDDEIIKATVLTRDGAVVNPGLTGSP
ncbi:MAG: Re/Si-specific NAD(P)(+) transhydrogenase subunit alpha [Alphaproteobacteria bacterium]